MTGHNELDAEGIPDLETPVNEDEGMIPPRDHPQGIFDERGGDTVAERSLREEPEEMPMADDEGIGTRLVDRGDEDVDAIDDEKDAVASLAEDDDTVAPSAEEAAMHITDSP